MLVLLVAYGSRKEGRRGGRESSTGGSLPASSTKERALHWLTQHEQLPLALIRPWPQSTERRFRHH